jgi:hypothetical protein
MTKTFESRMAISGRIGRFQGSDFSTEADASLIGRFKRIPCAELKDRLLGIGGIFRRDSSGKDPIFTGRPGYRQELEELRNRAYLDIGRNIR